MSPRFIAHADHGLGPQHLDLVQAVAERHSAFFIETVELPAELPDLQSGIYGPSVGDEPVPESAVRYAVRGNRAGPSRLVNRPTRPTRLLTVIGGPGRTGEQIIYTAFGGPAAPREWWDAGLFAEQGVAGVHASAAFWAQHALAAE